MVSQRLVLASLVSVLGLGPLVGGAGIVAADCGTGLALVASGGALAPGVGTIAQNGAIEATSDRDAVGSVGVTSPFIRDAVECAEQCNPNLLYGVEGSYDLGAGVVIFHATCGATEVAECAAETLTRACSSGRIGAAPGRLGCHWHVVSGVQTGHSCKAVEPPVPIPIG